MCKPASMIVTKNKIFWSEFTDSHSEIIKEFNIKETDTRGDINIVPIEIYPANGKLNTPISKWEYHEDYAGYNRTLPFWYNKEKAEKTVRAALVHWKKKKVINRKTKELSSGQYYIYSEVKIVTGNTILNLYGSSTVQRMMDSSTVQKMMDSSIVQKMYGSSTVQKMMDSSNVQSYHNIDNHIIKSLNAVIIDRSGSQVKVYTKEN